MHQFKILIKFLFPESPVECQSELVEDGLV